MRLFIAAAGFVTIFTTTAWAENWPQWRGPKNDGHSNEKGLPTEWSSDKNILWKLKMPGQGSSTPAVWGKRIFLTSADGDDIVLLCVSTDGQEQWKQKLSNTGRVKYKGGEGNDASASCSTDGRYVWTFVGNGQLVCYTVDGKLVWNKDLQSYGRFNIQFGCHWTPVLYKGNLYVQVMHRGAQKLVAFEATTGRELWQVDRPGYGRGESPDTYASPFIWEGEGGPLLVAHGNDYCTGHKLDNGEEVWRVYGLNPTNNSAWRFVSCPLVTADLIVVPSCKNGPTVAFHPVGAKGRIDPDNKNELWRIKSTPDVVAPIRVEDVVYFTDNGPFTAVDAKTGTQLYREQLTKALHRAQMVAADGKIYITAVNGATDVVQAGRTFQRISTNKLPDTFYASPAIADGRIYLRGWDYLWAIGTK
ncbi:MAG: PQQ-binding-like beta-propeller repeat protein [Gemmataceae bacterium]|nr:PQQ-binding-like beta-propeller repeat protein [Gemmata sp.]MDW8196380.1 PQQ-binding-like beta-propeller repeat protein [Gemmataceae bacterium]